jgi:ribosomal protein L28
MSMPRPYLVGWGYAIKWIYNRIKTHGWISAWRTRRIFLQMIKKKWFWTTPEERVAAVEKGLEALRQIGESIRKNAPEYYEELRRRGYDG